jgi:hypothetical protein
MKPYTLSKACRCQSVSDRYVCVYSSTGVPGDDAQDLTFSIHSCITTWFSTTCEETEEYYVSKFWTKGTDPSHAPTSRAVVISNGQK